MQITARHRGESWNHPLKHYLSSLAPLNKTPLPGLLSACGIKDLGDLTFNQALMFIAASNVFALVKTLPIPAGNKKSKDEMIWKFDLPRQTESQRIGSELHDTRIPSEYMDFGMIEGADELPLIHRDQFLLLESTELEFLRRLSSQELSRDVFQEQRPKGDLDKGQTDNEIPEVDSLENSDTILKAHALLDISDSMNNKDNRSLIARGVQIAFMRLAYYRGQELHFRPFNSEVGFLTSGRDSSTLSKIIQRVLRLKNTGETSIQKALSQSFLDTQNVNKKVSQRVDLLLVSDGESRINGRPQADAKLHTIIIGDPIAERRSPQAIKDARENLRTLESISESFYQIGKDDFQKYLVPMRQDLLSLYSILESVPEELDSVVTEEEALRIAKRVQIIKALIKTYKYGIKDENKEDELVDALEEIADAFLKDLTAKSLEERVKENRAKANNGDLRAREAFEKFCGPTEEVLPDEEIDETPKERRRRRRATGRKGGQFSMPSFVIKFLDLLSKFKDWIWKSDTKL